jgi:hypothetical protein
MPIRWIARPVPIPHLGPGFAFIRYPAQVLFATAALEMAHTSPSTLTILGAEV